MMKIKGNGGKTAFLESCFFHGGIIVCLLDGALRQTDDKDRAKEDDQQDHCEKAVIGVKLAEMDGYRFSCLQEQRACEHSCKASKDTCRDGDQHGCDDLKLFGDGHQKIEDDSIADGDAGDSAEEKRDAKPKRMGCLWHQQPGDAYQCGAGVADGQQILRSHFV